MPFNRRENAISSKKINWISMLAAHLAHLWCPDVNWTSFQMINGVTCQTNYPPSSWPQNSDKISSADTADQRRLIETDIEAHNQYSAIAASNVHSVIVQILTAHHVNFWIFFVIVVIFKSCPVTSVQHYRWFFCLRGKK